MEPIRSGRRGYVDLDTLHTENLEVVADAFQMELGTPEEKMVDQSLASLTVLAR